MNDRLRRNAGADAGDDQGEMSFRHRPDQRVLDALIQGRLPAEHDGLADVAAFVDAVRLEATVVPRPTAELAAVLDEGITVGPAVRPVDDGAEPSRGRRPSARPVRRTRQAFGSLVASVAAMGLATKAAVASTAVLAATAGAGFGGVLPTPVQAPFDQVVGIDRTEEELDRRDGGPATPDDAPGSPDEGPASTGGTVRDGPDRSGDARRDRPEEGTRFGDGVSGDATQEDDPGVDGAEVGDDASDGQSEDARQGAGDPGGDVGEAPPEDRGAEVEQPPASTDQQEAPPVDPPADPPPADPPPADPQAGADGSETAPRDAVPPSELQPENQPAPDPGSDARRGATGGRQ